jgi:hypothetical protein
MPKPPTVAPTTSEARKLTGETSQFGYAEVGKPLEIRLDRLDTDRLDTDRLDTDRLDTDRLDTGSQGAGSQGAGRLQVGRLPGDLHPRRSCRAPVPDRRSLFIGWRPGR